MRCWELKMPNKENRKPEGFITWNGGEILDQDNSQLFVKVLVKDQRGYAFHTELSIAKRWLKMTAYEE